MSKVEEKLHRSKLHRRMQEYLGSKETKIVDDLDVSILKLLERFGKWLRVDRSGVFILNNDGSCANMTHAWQSDELDSSIDVFRSIPLEQDTSWLMIRLAHEGLFVVDVAGLPSDADALKIQFQRQGTQSFLIAPIHGHQGKLVGFILFDCVSCEPCWQDDELDVIQLFSETLHSLFINKQAEIGFAESEHEFRSIINASPMGVHLYEIQENSRLIFKGGNPAADRLLMTEHTKLVGLTIEEAFPSLIETDVPERYKIVAKIGGSWNSEQFFYDDGRLSGVFEFFAFQISPRKMAVFFNEISERKNSERELRLAASVFSTAREGIMITDAEGIITDVNDAFTFITGYERDECVGKSTQILNSGFHDNEFYEVFWGVLNEKRHWRGEIWNRRKNGELYPEMLSINAIVDSDDKIQHFVAVFSDITSLKEYQKQLEQTAHYDALTNLPNRVLLSDRLHQAMSRTRRQSNMLAVVFIDLDGFKSINDNHGHEVGDSLLAAVSKRMKSCLRENDTLARFGGDEFVAVLTDLSNISDCVPVLNRLLTTVAESHHIGKVSLHISASLGVTYYPQSEHLDADQLMRQADQSMYQAKLAGKNRYHVFDVAKDCSLRGIYENIERIRHGLERNEFTLYYQPKVNMRTGAVVGVEALIRWQHPDQGLLAPAAFLPVIEDHPLSIEVGEWVIETALTQMEIWHSAGLALPMSVNVGARQLQHPNFVNRLHKILTKYPSVRTEGLEIEVLETSALAEINQVSSVIKQCGDWDVSFAIDDFGTGYSSLTYLKRLAVNTLKIDQSFVRDMLFNSDDLAILESIVSLAAAFNRKVIAEGVETVEHGQMLLKLGCEFAQGYGIARPMPAEKIPLWAESWQSPDVWRNCKQISPNSRSLLYAAVEHRRWVVATEHFINGEQDTPPQLDHHSCRFGQWLDAERQTIKADCSELKKIASLHKELHLYVENLCKLHSDGNTEESFKGLSDLHTLSDALLEKLKDLEKSL